MIVSHSKKFVFIHIFKTAGTSIRAALLPYQSLRLRAVLTAYRAAWTVAPRALSRKITHRAGRIKHGNYVQATRWISDEQMRDYFKFAFVRNPWDWTVSLYFYILKEKDHHWHPEVSRMSDFGEFLDFYLGTQPRTQKSFLVNGDGQIMMDFVGRFENLNADFGKVCQRLDIQQNLGKKNTSNHRPYMEYYTPERRDSLGEFFEEDIREFNYTFIPDDSKPSGILETAAE